MSTYVVLMGAPGAGKGTQAKLLEAALGLPQVATGDLFRANLKNNTELGLLARTFMDKGELVPDEVTVAMVRDRLAQEDCAQGAILDGFPRNVIQAEALDRLLTEFGGEIAVVPHIFVDSEVLVARLLKRAEIEGRADDNEETIRTRMRVYNDETAPLLALYKSRDLMQKIDGKQTIAAVQADLITAIKGASV
jgi:adenylate kinase